MNVALSSQQLNPLLTSSSGPWRSLTDVAASGNATQMHDRRAYFETPMAMSGLRDTNLVSNEPELEEDLPFDDDSAEDVSAEPDRGGPIYGCILWTKYVCVQMKVEPSLKSIPWRIFQMKTSPTTFSNPTKPNKSHSGGENSMRKSPCFTLKVLYLGVESIWKSQRCVKNVRLTRRRNVDVRSRRPEHMLKSIPVPLKP